MRFYLFHPNFWVFIWWHEFPQASFSSSALLYLIQWGQRLVNFRKYIHYKELSLYRGLTGEKNVVCYTEDFLILRFFVSGLYGTTAVEDAITERAIAVRVHPGCFTGARILLPRGISQQYHANEDLLTVRPFSIFRKVSFVAVAFLYL